MTTTTTGLTQEDSGNPGRRASVAIALLVVAYVLVVGALALSGRFTFVWKTSVVPILLLAALLTRQAGRFVRDWAPLLGAVVLFDCLRGLVFGLVTAFRLPVYARYVITVEEALFEGYTLPNLVQAVFLQEGVIGPFEKALVVVHGSHFFAFLVFGFAVWLLRRDSFDHFCASVILLLAAGITLYLIVPTVPPWMAASRFHLIPPIHHVSASVYNTLSPMLGQTFDVNPIAAMPSLHTAIPVLCSFIAWRHFRARGLIIAAYTLAVCVAIVYLGEHYYVDVVAGAALAAGVFLVVYRTDALGVIRRSRAAALLRARAARFPTVAPLAIGLLLAITAEGLGQVGASLRKPLHVDETFVRRELLGRSDLATLFMSKFAAERGDRATARRLAEQAANELTDARDRQLAAEFLSRLPPAN